MNSPRKSDDSYEVYSEYEEECLRRRAAAAAKLKTTIHLRIVFPDVTPFKSIEKVMTNVVPWFTNKDCEVKCVDADIFCITGQTNHVEKLMQPGVQHRMKGVDVFFYEVKTTSLQGQEQQLRELEKRILLLEGACAES